MTVQTSHDRQRDTVAAAESHSTPPLREAAIESLRQAHDVVGLAHRLADATQRQTEHVGQAVRDIEGMALSASGVNETTNQTTVATQHAVQATETGTYALRDAQEALQIIRETTMRASRQVELLGSSARSMSRAVLLVQQNTQDLHLIAGNAAIEAARQQQSGGYVRAVANSIEHLAQQSQRALNEIEQSITATQTEISRVVAAIEAMVTDVVRGTRAMNAAGDALESLDDGMRHLASLNVSISRASQEQVRLAAGAFEQIERLEREASSLSEQAARQANAALDMNTIVTTIAQTIVEM